MISFQHLRSPQTLSAGFISGKMICIIFLTGLLKYPVHGARALVHENRGPLFSYILLLYFKYVLNIILHGAIAMFQQLGALVALEEDSSFSSSMVV